ncbi:uncharacterized protein LOC141627534 [Silene latifolia]|uniref:uncharacterized protein LOC141627534 n=1 Tax=Silene latifolia TaxID=37657 RepID=UPI003D772DDE
MKISSWNIRGGNDPIKQQEVLEFLRFHQVDIMGILETRIKEKKATKIIQNKFKAFKVICNYNAHVNGRIWVNKWVLLGDFNVVRDVSERISNTPPNLADILDCNSCHLHCGVADITSSGCEMTWTNKQDIDTLVWSKLDRALTNALPGNFIILLPLLLSSPLECPITPLFSLLVFEDKHSGSRFSFLNSLDPPLVIMICKKLSLIIFLIMTPLLNTSLLEFKKDNNKELISHIKDKDGNERIGLDSVAEGFIDYYQHLLGQSHPTCPIDVDFIQATLVCLEDDILGLIKPIENDEIRVFVFSIGSDKSPVRMGFLLISLRLPGTLLDLIIAKLFKHTLRMATQKQANATLITLIPKKSWIMGCITSSWFSIKINGSVHGFFQGKSGLRQVLNTLNDFSKWSGLSANTDKTDIYFGGVTAAIKHQAKSSCILVFLRVPSPSDILASLYTAPETLLIIMSSLLNSRIFGLTNFSCATALLPKNVVKLINKLCKNFFWNHEDGHRKLVFKSWSDICSPWNEGGVDIKELLSWNKAVLAKWIWTLDSQHDGLWSRWIATYYFSPDTIWSIQSKDHFSERIYTWLGLQGRSTIPTDELLWCAAKQHSRHWKNGWIRSSITATCYQIWHERNARIFQGVEHTEAQILHLIRFNVSARISHRVTRAVYDKAIQRLILF